MHYAPHGIPGQIIGASSLLTRFKPIVQRKSMKICYLWVTLIGVKVYTLSVPPCNSQRKSLAETPMFLTRERDGGCGSGWPGKARPKTPGRTNCAKQNRSPLTGRTPWIKTLPISPVTVPGLYRHSSPIVGRDKTPLLQFPKVARRSYPRAQPRVSLWLMVSRLTITCMQ